MVIGGRLGGATGFGQMECCVLQGQHIANAAPAAFRVHQRAAPKPSRCARVSLMIGARTSRSPRLMAGWRACSDVACAPCPTSASPAASTCEGKRRLREWPPAAQRMPQKLAHHLQPTPTLPTSRCALRALQ
jgi:hypothetical protein